ncbi:MAG: hypothetical protein BV456_00320 [Thermoplasmata archaeon M8B2D]|nr:MAG: hypothetical protein BV456_00320 [Thermoplasmata archaeon M8B2D]
MVFLVENNLIGLIKDFMKKEKINFSVSEDNPSEFWLDDSNGSITIRFKLDANNHEILYDVYSPEFSVHLKEETLKDVENLEFLAEENRKWKIAEIIEDVWLIIDQIRLWAFQNNYRLLEKQLI